MQAEFFLQVEDSREGLIDDILAELDGHADEPEKRSHFILPQRNYLSDQSASTSNDSPQGQENQPPNYLSPQDQWLLSYLSPNIANQKITRPPQSVGLKHEYLAALKDIKQKCFQSEERLHSIANTLSTMSTKSPPQGKYAHVFDKFTNTLAAMDEKSVESREAMAYAKSGLTTIELQQSAFSNELVNITAKVNSLYIMVENLEKKISSDPSPALAGFENRLLDRMKELYASQLPMVKDQQTSTHTHASSFAPGFSFNKRQRS
ncbi:hypothetical protein COCMIDRAFT_7179 [Bipolaris oryzae ATCC 44560]|uniref:Uncharacterized protein n=1 Tax=Bipolaris oryzae ATCC 44560 TaxID=930090 RepID=W6Z729_COCMI|nr:uncharacterized protein COCMIDRAFT_7179 [Bipolaris oryzae ATCC 44560]EUC43359.1 hypothetical protein COCMIDRAFT_7179 [Bipolaris oryzae ATCC 44560]